MTASPPEIPTPAAPSSPQWAAKDSLATSEGKHWADLEEARAHNDTRWLRWYGRVIVVFTLAFSGLFLASLLVWSFHYLAPACWGWLSPEQLAKVQSVLFSGGLGAIVSTIVQKQLAKSERR